MVQEERARQRRRKISGKEAVRRQDGRKDPSCDDSAAAGELPPDKPADIDALRKARLAYLNKSPEERRQKMKYVGEVVIKAPATKEDVRQVRRISESKRRHKATGTVRKPGHRSVRTVGSKRGDREDEDDNVDDYVYGRREDTATAAAKASSSGVTTIPDDETEAPRPSKPRRTTPASAGKDLEREAESVHRSRTRRTNTTRVEGGVDGEPEVTHRSRIRRTKTVKVEEDHNDGPSDPRRAETRSTKSVKVEKEKVVRREPQRRQSEPLRRRNSYGIDECEPFHRFTSPRETVRPPMQRRATTTQERERPPLQRSATSARTKTDDMLARTTSASEHAKKGPSIFSNLLRSAAPLPEKKMPCLTCGSDDVPISKSVKLACSHRMCHDCLRRIFTMSVTDPAHMPPRCCTSEHIPLKHVDRLFDQKFKKTWNRKFQEYNTKNRIYCPARGCGEWIKPNHIALEHGRKVGKCKRCSTRVCCICNNRMHTSRECPKDPATKQFVEVAKQKGWQKCYSCSAMVELKEGCNHMTCRCTAEFCMVCGVKWKGCDCPWFNYDAVGRNAGDPIRYQEELDRRREQERRDAGIARRMQDLGVDDDHDDNVGDETFGIGNAAGHHMNANYLQQAQDLLTGPFQRAARGAQGLVNGMVTGRENPLPFMPLPPDQMAQFLRQPSRRAAPVPVPAHAHARVEAEVPLPALLPARRSTFRRQGDLGAVFNGRSQTTEERRAEQRIEDWMHEVPVGAAATGL